MSYEEFLNLLIYK